MREVGGSAIPGPQQQGPGAPEFCGGTNKVRPGPPAMGEAPKLWMGPPPQKQKPNCYFPMRLTGLLCFIMPDNRITKALSARRESKSIEFKAEFNPTDVGASIELLKDIISIANSGGGVIVIGLDNNGEPSGADVAPVIQHDHARYCDLIHKYTLQHFADFEVFEESKSGSPIALFLINAPDFPLVFQKPGQYAIDNNRQQKTAFGQGTLYFRHGAKSEHGTTEDLRGFFEKRMREIQEMLLGNIKQVVEAPRGSTLQMVNSAMALPIAGPDIQVRLTNNPNAPAVIAVDKGRLCPHRQKDVLRILRERLPNGPTLTSHDLVSINSVHNIQAREDLCWIPDFSAKQYSDVYVNWIVDQIRSVPTFLADARRHRYNVTYRHQQN
jgi:Putative DNA-binding domain